VKSGLSFTLTPDLEKRLAAAGAGKAILDAVHSYVTQSTPAPTSPAKPEGTVTVYCEPVDCAFFVNGKESGKTQQGKSQSLTLAEGAYAIGASAIDYQTPQPEKLVAIKNGVNGEVRFQFQPSREALERAGKRLYDIVAGGLGIEALKDATSFQAEGTFTLFDRDGKQSAWDLAVIYQAPSTAKFMLTRGNETYTAIHTASGYAWDKAPAEAASLEDVLMPSCSFQVAVLLRQLGTSRYRLIANRLTPIQGQETTFRAEGSPDSYVIVADAEMHVKEIRIESSSLNNGMRALYGEYTSESNRSFAEVTQVLLPDGPRHGVEVHYANVTYRPILSDSTFLLHKKKKH
jgi:hypothetical protein